RRTLELSRASDTAASAVNGGQTTMSSSLTVATSRLIASTRPSASAAVLFIFQLPAMISLLCFSMKGSVDERGDSPVLQRRDSRQFLALEELQARAAARAHERHLSAEPGAVDRLHAVAAADDRLRTPLRRLGHGPRDRKGSLRETRILEDAHGP